MSIIVHRQYGLLTTVAGTALVTVICKNNSLQNIFVKSKTSSTTFDVTITDVDNLVIYQRADITEELNEEINLLSDGNFTLTIENSSVDEDFIYKVKFNEGNG